VAQEEEQNGNYVGDKQRTANQAMVEILASCLPEIVPNVILAKRQVCRHSKRKIVILQI
jgi:hypothetical protein